MCIRDSAPAAQPDRHADAVAGGANAAGRRRTGAHATGQQPVSYTHLRAHETVLDLVCRLLLEKKNQSTDTPTKRI